MAHSTNFFGLRRGSTKSLTFQVLRGEQITKDRVSYVKNPQSTPQMRQRLIVPLVASARAQLAGLVDHSFEGTAYGETSLKKFSSINLQKGNLTPTCYVPKGAMDAGVANYIVSQGSLPSLTLKNVTAGNEASKWDMELVNFPLLANGRTLEDYHYLTGIETDTVEPDEEVVIKYGAAKLAAELLGLPKSHQITFLVEYPSGDYELVTSNTGGETVQTLHKHSFAIARIMNADDVERNVSVDLSDRTLYITVNNSPITIAMSISTGIFKEDGTKLTKDEEAAYKGKKYLGGSVEHLYIQLNNSTSFISAAAAIYSDQSSISETAWRRSTQRLMPTGYETAVTYKDVVDSYLKTGKSSLRYLNNGNDNTGLAGQDITSSATLWKDPDVEKTQG